MLLLQKLFVTKLFTVASRTTNPRLGWTDPFNLLKYFFYLP